MKNIYSFNTILFKVRIIDKKENLISSTDNFFDMLSEIFIINEFEKY